MMSCSISGVMVAAFADVQAHEVVRCAGDFLDVVRDLVRVELRLRAKGDRRRRFVAEPVHGLAARRRCDGKDDEGTEDG